MLRGGEALHYYTQIIKYTNTTVTWSYSYNNIPFLFGIHYIWVYTSHTQSKDSFKFKFGPDSARVAEVVSLPNSFLTASPGSYFKSNEIVPVITF